MRKTSSKTIAHYYLSGVRCYLPHRDNGAAHGVELDRDISVLDFGCGVARELLHFKRFYPEPKYFACDIDATSVSYVTKNFDVDCYKNEFEPPLRYATSSMDMVYSVSKFFSFGSARSFALVARLLRVTKPGQFCFLTTEGLAAFEFIKRGAVIDPTEESRFRRLEFYTKNTHSWRWNGSAGSKYNSKYCHGHHWQLRQHRDDAGLHSQGVASLRI